MNRRQKNQDKRNQKIVAVLDAHPEELLTVPAVADAATELRRRLGLVPDAVKKQRTGRQAKGAIRVKNDLEPPLIKQLVKAANALNLYYRKSQQLDRALALHLRPSEYTNMGQTDLALEAQDVTDQVAEHLKDLAPYGFKKASGSTPGSDAVLQAQVDAYVASLPVGTVARSQGKVGTGAVRTVFRDLSEYLDGEFRSAVELLVDEHPNLYQLLREALRIDNTGGGKKAKGDTKPTPGA